MQPAGLTKFKSIDGHPPSLGLWVGGIVVAAEHERCRWVGGGGSGEGRWETQGWYNTEVGVRARAAGRSVVHSSCPPSLG